MADRNTHLDSKGTQDPKVVPDPFVLPEGAVMSDIV